MRLALLLTLLCSCLGPKADGDSAAPDADGDGYPAPADCDDGDSTVYPGATERCDGKDGDCDGTTDEDAADATLWYSDADGDGHGDPARAVLRCGPASGEVADNTDCDDNAAEDFPGAAERCDGRDNDCDGAADEDPVDPSAWYSDADGDGYGDPASSTSGCTAPGGSVADNTDCDDSDPARSPGAPELCNTIDDDCDGATDESDAADAARWYADADSDGYGDPSAGVPACEEPDGFVPDNTDCDDGEASVHPEAPELCGGGDEDCDATVDESTAEDAQTWYADADADGYGDGSQSQRACVRPGGSVGDSTDCDDNAAGSHPGAPERCGGGDEDCDAAVDESTAEDAQTWYADADADGYGDAGWFAVSCDQSAGTVSDATDCDDADPLSNPGAPEVCGGGDEDCDSSTDESTAIDAPIWYADADTDGYGDAARPAPACVQPPGAVSDATDCDDGDGQTNPGADELCGGGDEDCDQQVDESSAADAPVWYTDGDGDGYGAGAGAASCTDPGGAALADADCDDADSGVHPGAAEQCGAPDQDCDGRTDDPESTDAVVWYSDADGDGYGDPQSPVSACSQSAGLVSDATDCDDGESTANPAGTEACWNGIDEDCDPNSVSCVAGVRYTDDAIATVYGTTTSGRLGMSLAAGDLNNDGLPDLAIGDYEGNTYVSFGPLSGDRDAASSDVVIVPASDMGALVSWIEIEDVDLSGTADLIVGMPSAGRTSGSAGGMGSGAVLLFTDPAPGSLTEADAATMWIGDVPFRVIGWSHGVVDDVNADSIPDLAILDATARSPNSVFIVSGADRGVVDGPGTALTTLSGDVSGAKFGQHLDVAEDLDGDGSRDILVSDSGLTRTTGLSSFWVVPGPAPTGAYAVDGVGFRVEGLYSSTTGAQVIGLSAPDDLNADGYSDVLVAERNGSYGAVFYIIPGPISPGTTFSDASATVRAPDNGWIDDVSAGGDLDGDSQPDIAVYSSDVGGIGLSNVHIYSGLPSGFIDGTGYVTMLIYSDRSVGHARITPLETRYDFNVDGLDDLALSHISDASNVYSGGRVYLIPGVSE